MGQGAGRRRRKYRVVRTVQSEVHMKHVICHCITCHMQGVFWVRYRGTTKGPTGLFGKVICATDTKLAMEIFLCREKKT